MVDVFNVVFGFNVVVQVVLRIVLLVVLGFGSAFFVVVLVVLGTVDVVPRVAERFFGGNLKSQKGLASEI